MMSLFPWYLTKKSKFQALDKRLTFSQEHALSKVGCLAFSYAEKTSKNVLLTEKYTHFGCLYDLLIRKQRNKLFLFQIPDNCVISRLIMDSIRKKASGLTNPLKQNNSDPVSIQVRIREIITLFSAISKKTAPRAAFWVDRHIGLKFTVFVWESDGK